MKIGIFGGAFNPIHKGHIKIAKEAIKQLDLDKLFFVPCYKGPFKKNVTLEKTKDRINMINLVLEEKMELSIFEVERQGVSYTIDTVRYFQQKYPNDQLFLIIGSDNILKLSKWKDIDQISKMCQITAFKRAKSVNKTNLKKYGGILLNNELSEESSTRFINGHFKDVDEKVRKYIGQNKLYIKRILENTLSQKRYLHSIHAMNFAIEIAKSLNFDIDKASFAAMVHDIAKEIPEEEARIIINKYEKQNNNIDKYKLHQEVGYIILKYYLFVEEEICHSVRVHTSLDFELSLLDKIVFMADKLCQGRKWEGIQKIRQMTLTNFDEAFKLVVSKTKEFNLKKGIVFSNEQEGIYKKWEK